MIYFIQAEGVGHIKIGFTADGDAEGRMANLQTGSPVPLRLLGTMPGTMEDEKDLQRRFASSKVIGEWFKPIAEIMALANPAAVKTCNGAEIVAKSIQIKVLTVGRKQFSHSMLAQLPERELLDWGKFIAALDDISKEEAFARLSEFLEGEPWGWVNGVVIWLIFELEGSLFKQPVPDNYFIKTINNWNLQDDPFKASLVWFWSQCRKVLLANDAQLFIGV